MMHRREARGSGLPSPKRAWTATRPPYPGLEAFTEQDAGVFFAREAEIKQLVDRLHPRCRSRRTGS
jgi:hypothetical protein